jgi:hypothetical protein
MLKTAKSCALWLDDNIMKNRHVIQYPTIVGNVDFEAVGAVNVLELLVD